MKFITQLLQAKTYQDIGECVYCGSKATDDAPLTDEHIIPDALGGQLVLPNSSCRACAQRFARDFEAFLLNQTLISPRTHLKLPSYKAPPTLRVGEFNAPDGKLPNLDHAEFEFKELPIEQHGMVIGLPDFVRPGVLRSAEPAPNYPVRSNLFQFYGNPPKRYPSAERQQAEFRPFTPEGVSKEMAKIAHSAACAVFERSSFTPMLPALLSGIDPNISHLVGTGDVYHKSANLHEIWFKQSDEHLIGYVQLFAKYGFKPYEVVVGEGTAKLKETAT